jgi:SpoIIAA-like
MPITVRHEHGNLYRVEIRGTLRQLEFRQGERELASAVTRSGALRMLVILDQFEGWDPGDDWRDLAFFVTHGDAVERIAIVGAERWRSGALMFAGRDLRKAPVEFFSNDHLGDACAWVSE